MFENSGDGASLRNPESLVFLTEERAFGFMVGGMGAYYTTVQYVKGGIEYEVLMENNEFDVMESGPIGYD